MIHEIFNGLISVSQISEEVLYGFSPGLRVPIRCCPFQSSERANQINANSLQNSVLFCCISARGYMETKLLIIEIVFKPNIILYYMK